MADEITVRHSGVTIVYRTEDNRWAFELRGRQRSTESLTKAKEAIDKPVDEKTEKPFQRIKVYVNARYGNSEYTEAEVTSLAEGSRYSGGQCVWIQSGKKRAKEYAYNCYPITEANASLVREMKQIDAEIERLHGQRDDLRKRLIALKIS